MHPTSLAFPPPKLALFWFVGDDLPAWRLVSVRWAVDWDGDALPKRPPCTHRGAWWEVAGLDRTLADYRYDFFPRGRLEYFPPTRRWIFSIDKQLARGDFVDYLADIWRLPKGHVTVIHDPAYRSANPCEGHISCRALIL